MTEPDYRSEIETAPITPTNSRSTALIGGVVLVTFVGVIAFVRWRIGQEIVPATPVDFELRLAETAPAGGLTIATIADGTGRTVYLHQSPIITNAEVVSAEAVENKNGVAISFSLNTIGAARLRQATATHFNRPMAILIDGQVMMAPIVRAQLGAKGVIQGSFTVAQADRIARGITGRK